MQKQNLLNCFPQTRVDQSLTVWEFGKQHFSSTLSIGFRDFLKG